MLVPLDSNAPPLALDQNTITVCLLLYGNFLKAFPSGTPPSSKAARWWQTVQLYRLCKSCIRQWTVNGRRLCVRVPFRGPSAGHLESDRTCKCRTSGLCSNCGTCKFGCCAFFLLNTMIYKSEWSTCLTTEPCGRSVRSLVNPINNFFLAVSSRCNSIFYFFLDKPQQVLKLGRLLGIITLKMYSLIDNFEFTISPFHRFLCPCTLYSSKLHWFSCQHCRGQTKE